MNAEQMALDLLRRFVNADRGAALMTDPCGIALIDSGWVDVTEAEMAFLVSLSEEELRHS